MFHVEKLGYDNIEELLDIMREKAKWLIKNDRGMWDISKLNKEAIIQRYDYPELFVSYENKNKVGGFLLIEYDKKYWKENRDEKAYYLHKFVVKTGFGGKGYSQRMLEWIKDYGKENGKQYIRLDYYKNRTYLRNLYLRHGFNDVEELETENWEIMIKGEYKIY